MRSRAFLVCLSFLSYAVPCALAQVSQSTGDVHWCPAIPISEAWKEARLTAVFVFDLDANGKPVHVKSAHVPLMKDDGPLLSCISGWKLPSEPGKVTAEILWEWGCKSIEIYANGVHKSFPCQPPNPSTQAHAN